jgi:uncharacterized protein YutE (UPF0331/DUF86 family)
MLPSNRPNTEIQKLLQTLNDVDSQLDVEIKSTPLGSFSVYYLAEVMAWCLVRLASSVVFSKRLSIPGSDAEVFSVLQKADLLDLVTARKLKQFCELRHLASRDVHTLNGPEIVETLKSRSEILALVPVFLKEF